MSGGGDGGKRAFIPVGSLQIPSPRAKKPPDLGDSSALKPLLAADRRSFHADGKMMEKSSAKSGIPKFTPLIVHSMNSLNSIQGQGNGSSKEPRKPGSWAALFRETNSFVNLKEEAATSVNLKQIQLNSSDLVEIDEDMIDFSRSLWENSLYGKFYGKTPSIALVQAVLPKIWKVSCSMQIVDIASGYFCFKFANKDDMNRVLSGGQWFLKDQVLLLSPWKNNFQSMAEQISSIPVWIQLPGLSLEYIQRDILISIASSIGKPIKIDDITLKGQRARFARICILWDLNKSVPQGVWIKCRDGKFWRSIAFENILKLYYSCGKIGHTSSACTISKEVSVDKCKEVAEAQNGGAKSTVTDIPFSNEGSYGPWMIINRRKKFQEKRNKDSVMKVANGFDKLAELEVMNKGNSLSIDPVPVKDSSLPSVPQSTSDANVSNKSLQNPFRNKNADCSMSPKVMVDAFMTSNSISVPIKLDPERNAIALHKKLSDTLAITVSKIQESGDYYGDGLDIEMATCSQNKAGKIRKPSSQAIHESCFPSNLKQNRAKKKEVFKRPKSCRV
ncbi:hypothetical protein Cni_G25463 [Canna indica]|uniref:DUF4283 domain-containing protein n=1 Tax=Canna indica TaxID=4628 RepID=A0AAQ3KXY1_9LILI|nr:hypothetical protein Cni_G25463 [Canna indica]